MKIQINLASPPVVIFTALFVGLKLTGYISWPWLWTLAPLWGPIAVLTLICLILSIGTAVLDLFDR